MAKKKQASPKVELEWIVESLRPLAEPVDRLELDPRNARKHDEANLAAIAASLKRFGQRRPIVVNRVNGQIEAGNGTLLAARQLGWTHLAVVWVEDDPSSQTGFSLADNRTAELARWDQEMLQELLFEVGEQEAGLYDALLLHDLLEVDMTSTAEEEPARKKGQAAGDGEADAEQPVPESWSVVVECKDEDEQRTLYERMKGEGYTCRLLTL